MVIVLGTFVLIAILTLNIGWTLVGRSQDMDIELETAQLGAVFFNTRQANVFHNCCFLVVTRAGHSFFSYALWFMPIDKLIST